MQIEMKDKVVCVTGSARRVGRAIMLEFARQGAHVVIHHNSSDEEAASAAAEARALGVDALVVKANQSQPDEVTRMFAAIRSHYGRLDVMVNSAASFKRTPLLDIDFAEWQYVIGINLTGPFLCTQQAARLMIERGQGGVIINISDNSGLNPWKDRPHHGISKAGVIMLTRVGALSLAEHNIRVNCVVPGPVLVPAGESGEVLDRITQKLPLKRIGNPRNVAQACLFLAGNDFATGSILRVDGGEGDAGGQT